MFASFDPVALDMACTDMANRQPALPGSHLDGREDGDHFCAAHPTTDWKGTLLHAEKIVLGSTEYELVEI